MDKRQPADNNKAYYYHFDGLGSVVALSNSNGDSCQSYEYSVYGQVAASDPNHPNPYMFTGRRFDIETGLYYYRARYYNPHIGRFMQTDPVGYSAGMNWYAYCRNNPLSLVDPSGLEPEFVKGDAPKGDFWKRPSGHPQMPYPKTGPYYIQTDPMSCVAIAILNWWLTYGKALPVKLNSDLAAEKYVEKLIKDWEGEEGASNLMIAADIVGNAKHINSEPTADQIIAYVKNNQPVMFVYDVDARPAYDALHCVLIVPTPESYLNSGRVNSEARYSLVDAIHPQPYAMTEKYFRWWFSFLDGSKAAEGYIEDRLVDEYVVVKEINNE